MTRAAAVQQVLHVIFQQAHKTLQLL